MNRFETAQMLSYVSEIDGRRVTDEAVNVWLDLLGRFEFEEVRVAVVRHSMESTEFLKPAHVVGMVKTARRERLNKVAPTGVMVNPLDDPRGPNASKGDFELAKSNLHDVSEAIATGRLGRDQYNEYVTGRTPWAEYVKELPSAIEA